MGNPGNVGSEGVGGPKLVLFLDDTEWRHREFLKAMGLRTGVEVHRAWTADEAISLLREKRFDCAFLDHDLSDDDVLCRVGDRTAVPTGMAVVDHILSMESPPAEVVVHSCNPPAAAAMHARLEGHPAGIRVRRCAFPFLLESLR